MKNKNAINKLGFTLIELLIVVLIIGILSSIALPIYRKAVEKTKVADALNTISSIVSSQRHFFLAKRSYTKDFSDLNVDFVDKDGNKADGDLLDTTSYQYELLDNGILASRNNNEYYLYREYSANSQVMCMPGSHYMCAEFGTFTREPCDNAGLVWAKTNSTCYPDYESRCNDLYAATLGNDIWKDSYCGYTNQSSMTISEGMECNGTTTGGCQNSIVNDGGECNGTGQHSCKGSIINAGGVCNASHKQACQDSTIAGICYANTAEGCARSTITAGGICQGSCLNVTVEEGGQCIGKCVRAIVNPGGTCTSTISPGCQNAQINGGTCEGDESTNSCQYANVYNHGVCTGQCNQTTISEGSICSGRCQGATVSSGGVCSGICKAAKIQSGGVCSGGCLLASISEGGICKSSETNSCKNASYSGTGCCCGNYCGSKPKCSTDVCNALD